MTKSIVRQDIASLLDSWMEAERKGEKFPVLLEIASDIAGYSRKDVAKRKLKPSMEEKLFHRNVEKTAGRDLERITLSIDGLKHICLMAETEAGENIRQYFIESEKSLRLLKQSQEFPNQITGEVPSNPAAEFALKLSGVVDALFPEMQPEFRKGIAIEGVCKKHPELREALEPFKPRLFLEAPLLSPTDIGKMMEGRDGIKRSGIAINKLLIEKSLQVATGDKKLAYKAIGQGIEFSKVVADTAKGHGKTIQHLRWFESVIQLIQ